MAAASENILAVLKASYDYEPQPDAEEEIAIKENQLLFLLEKTDDDWWKVKVKPDSQDEESLSGLVPAAYVEPATHTSIVKALYAYEANQEGELTVDEDEMLLVFDRDEDWLLVQSQKEGGKVGYVPGNYVEETTSEEDTAEVPQAASPPAFDLSKLKIPDSPPKPAYTDPAELVNRSKPKGPSGPVETWSVSEVDKKGKKKKGTLGVGNGAMFFASESDKTPVQKWQTTDIQSSRIEKHKHVHIEVGGPSATSLHFNAGSKEVADAIMAKLEEARIPDEEEPAAEEQVQVPERPRSVAKSVHFDNSEPVIIPPREDEGVEADRQEEEPPTQVHDEIEGEGERAVVLYDFTADGDDEMTVHEGETLLVLDRDTDEWWKCRNARGVEGVVPANYLEVVPGSGGPQPSFAISHAREDDTAAREAEEAAARAEAERHEQEEEERRQKERKKAEAEQRAKAAAAAAEADRRRREQEREKQRQKEKELERAAAEEVQKQKGVQRSRDSSSEGSSPRKSNGDTSSRGSSDKRRPAPENTRVWHDRTGQFRVEAAFLGYAAGKLRLHKSNGVIIEVPSEKMSAEDMRYVEKATSKQQTPSSPRRNSDDEPLENRRKSLQPQPRAADKAAKKGPNVDWFEFFLSAGCDVDDCSRYALSFERDKIDEAILPDITESTMRSLGLREGDIIRVKKAIEQRNPKTGSPGNDANAEQLRRDEELAKHLQAEENLGRGSAPNLFAGPNGALKNNVRRGRPQPSKSLPPATVDLRSISSASDQIQRSGTPLANSPASTGTPSSVPGSSTSPAAVASSGFDDDAWTNRPSSTKPTASPPPAVPTPADRPASVPLAPPAPPAPAPPPAAPAPPASAPPSSVPPQSTGLAHKTEADIFDQLARISQIRTQSPAVPNRPATVTPSVTAPPPLGYQAGLGMGSSPAPISQHLQAQQTGILPPPVININAPRGPLAPIPVNQGLLQPLVATPTGYNNQFVSTRPQSAFQPSPSPSFLSAQPTGFPGGQQLGPQSAGFSGPQLVRPQSTGFQPQQSLGPQPTGFQPQQSFGPQPTGFQPQQSLLPQATGFQTQGSIYSQPTGLPSGFGNSLGPVNGMGSFQNNQSFTPIQSNPTGFNPGFAASPPPQQQQQQSLNTNPANIFAQMKSGTFGNDNLSEPQNANKYDALRPNPVTLNPQMTGWVGGYQTGQGFTGGYGFQQ